MRGCSWNEGFSEQVEKKSQNPAICQCRQVSQEFKLPLTSEKVASLLGTKAKVSTKQEAKIRVFLHTQ